MVLAIHNSVCAAPTPESVVQGYSKLVYANYADSLNSAQQMQNAINAFLAAPSQAGLDAAKKAWLNAREYYGQTEAFRFYGGPIDDENGPEGQINAWPMDESYVDYVQGNQKAGFINNTQFNINREALIAENERGGEENIATGWHAIEFLLWGQDLNTDGPGNRPYTDYVPGKGLNAERRAAYLREITALLIHDLNTVQSAWAPNEADNFRAEFEQGGKESIRKILVGLGSLSRGELAGERLEVALFSQDQEDEHSCFSDNTHRDAVTNAQGILNVWTGTYKQADGAVLKVPSLAELVGAKSVDLAKRTTQQIQNSVNAASAIQAPFDREIIGGSNAAGPKRVKATIDSLVEQSVLLVESASAIGITRLTLTLP
ncbi:imelysin family protein [Limnobacter parvus]|uniref:Iron-regulated protein n=1 Tax=Limnobacter parvus TaxID=2939690 RepID=A0ABT1XDY7_9BURK|nr:imelysin family protein [Limnobacter parvus]MCR2745507.1 iron-regulated protein [Limnobacter parvus]